MLACVRFPADAKTWGNIIEAARSGSELTVASTTAPPDHRQQKHHERKSSGAQPAYMRTRVGSTMITSPVR